MSGARSAGLIRKARSRAILAVRRSRLFPTTIPDKLGDDDRLAGTSLPEKVLVYFPDTAESLYQIEPWYAPLRALHAELPVVVVCQDSRTAARIRRDSGLTVLTIARYGRLDDLLARSDVRLALYVNHSPRNFECLRFTSLTHIYLGHGDSDKAVSASNQVKAYDFCFVAGQAAVNRIAEHVRRYDATGRCVLIGQPQLDGVGLLPVAPAPIEAPLPPARPRVLYAPTWEGAQPSVAYSSLASHARAMITALLDVGYAVTYRPHPLSGVTSGEYAGADAWIRRTLTEAAGDHRIDVGNPLAQSFDDAHLLISDVSGVALNWLPSGKPLIITTPATVAAEESSTGLTAVVPRLAVADLPQVAELVRRQLADDPDRAQRLKLIDHYFSETTDGAATATFVAECQRFAGER